MLWPVSPSLMEWPSPANTPFSSSIKVSVPTPAEESRTHMPARHCPAAASQQGVRTLCCWLPSRT